MPQIHKRIPFLSACLSVAVALLLGACVNEDSPCPPDPDPNAEKGVTLEFSIVTRNAARSGSRALLPPSGTPEIGFAAENYLDLDRLLFLLFDDQQTLIRVFRPQVEAEENTNYVKYSVRAFLNDPYFLEAEPDRNITFTIMVIGNYSRLTPQNIAYHVGQKLQDIFTPSAVGTFAMPESSPAWIPSIEGGTYANAFGYNYTITPAQIPMSGMQTFTVETNKLLASTVENPLQLSAAADGSQDINMLRALAKIEIVDRISATGTGTATVQPPLEQRSWVEKAELIGYTTRGSILPTFDQWNLDGSYETQYVTSPSVPTGAQYRGEEPTNGLTTTYNALVDFFADTDATNARADGCRVFSCYLTEYNPLNRGTVAPMWIRVTAQSPLTGSGPTEETSTFYRMEVAPYTDNAPGASLPILRNNIYRYEITGINTDLQLKLIVDDWTAHETTWEYSDNPGLAEDGYLQWEVNADDINEANAEVFITYSSGATPNILLGTFTFAEPKGGTWTASLIPADATTATDAFIFVDEEGKQLVDNDGNPVNTASGPINGTQSSIRIVAKYPATTIDRKMRLNFTVETPDHRLLSADVLGGNYGTGNKYFTITQNASL